MSEGIKIKFGSVGWFLYFMLSIAVIGSFFGYVASAPFFLLGIFWPPAIRLGDALLFPGIRLLMDTQPWLDARVELPELAARRGVLLVSNHRSHLDAFLLLSRIRGVRILARRSLFRVPGLGLMMRLCRHIPCERGDLGDFQAAFRAVRERLEAGEIVHVFPELTRCEPGHDGVRPFVLAPFHAAIQAGSPIVPVAIAGTDGAWPRGALRIASGRKILVRALAPLDPARYRSPDDLRSAAHQGIRQALQNGLREIPEAPPQGAPA